MVAESSVDHHSLVPPDRYGRHVPLTKKRGVSGESALSLGIEDIHIEKHDKDNRTWQRIREAILCNDFLKNLELPQVEEIVNCMHTQHFAQGTLVIRQGDVGSHLFVSTENELEVTKDGEIIGKVMPWRAFGELAILYNCTRTASVRALEDSKVWMMDRKAFHTIMMKTGLQRREDNLKFLKSVPLLEKLPDEILTKVADALEVDFYPSGEYIVREGATGDTFFIISKGNVVVTQKHLDVEEEIRSMSRGEYFGERALLRDEKRTANVIAAPPGVECLTLNRESFKELIGDLLELKEKQKEYDEWPQNNQEEKRLYNDGVFSDEIEEEDFRYLTLEDLEVVTTLGVGAFGRVDLVQCPGESRAFALKCLRKDEIVSMEQQHHVLNEKNVMKSCRHMFICRLHRTFKDKKYVYLLMEACLGGEVWTYLRDRGRFDELTTRFYAACVVDALEYLHDKQIVYRDLKPENLMLDSAGYLKLVDFGFASHVSRGRKTWTFCGTPEYVAPETVLNKGHDRAVDFWALGILLYELLTGAPPFRAAEPMDVYTLILKGIDSVHFPDFVPRVAQHLIRKLCKENAAERLGYQRGVADIRKHRWFQGFHWEGLRNQNLTPPIIPQVSGPHDTHNFDEYPRDCRLPDDEESGWDEHF
ncbi:cGMP-dependent protein kinase, isozyme 1-like [Uloborus diversus]|uniref:cGMP-dependent protein kinase, isozyme 1-like n=1 Tax=Uloborus diversus TaxID=327109 RepID=UPI00240A6880|nr:cGMP-dependent protein kinase, isozyme 1-like [Uloborus diversus]